MDSRGSGDEMVGLHDQQRNRPPRRNVHLTDRRFGVARPQPNKALFGAVT